VTRVALIGLGTMGAPFARNLVAAGHELVGCDVDPSRADALGIAAAATPAAVAAGADVTLLSLPSPAAVEEVALGVDGVAAGAAPGSVLVDMSTGPPRLARELAARLGERGIDVLDAPVSGGPHGAAAATLTIMVGGPKGVFERVRPLFDDLGHLVVHVGGHGAGQAAKLCNNLLAGVTMAALAEACAIAEREGIEPATLYELLAASTGDSRVLRNRFPLAGVDPAHPSSRAWEPLFALDLIAKDLALVAELAHEHGVEPTLATTALAEYARASESGLGALDYSAVFLSTRAVE
jgi:3-hydroxyisobutyrate dehydrogenase